MVELHLSMKRRRNAQPKRCSHDATAACHGKSERRRKPCEQGALAQRKRRSVSEYAPLKNRFSKRSRSRWTGVENRRNLLRLNLGYVNDVWKEWLKRSEPCRPRNHLGSCRSRRLQVFATRQITASISFLRPRGVLFLRMHRTLRTYARV